MLGFVRPSNAFSCRNGAYIAVDWVQKEKNSDEINAYVTRLRSANIHDYFVFANGFKSEQHIVRLANFLNHARSSDPELRIYAMIGRRLCGESKQKCVDIADQKQQSSLAGRAKALWDAGFDGVQLDLEPVVSGSTELVSILSQVRAEKPHGKTLSLAGYLVASDRDTSSIAKPRARPASDLPILSWSRAYYERLIGLIDHVMLMNYDTAIRDPVEYRTFTAWQTREIQKIASAKSIKVQVGLPSNVPGRKGLFDRKAENLTSGSLGITDALLETGSECPKDFGVAIFTVDGLTPDMLSAFVKSWATPIR